MMKDAQPTSIYLKDYQVPEFLIDETVLEFDLDPKDTRVKARLHIRRNPKSEKKASPLVLDGQELRLLNIAIDGSTLSANDYWVSDESLTIYHVSDQFELETEVAISPSTNTSLEGLYKSRTMYCTQCEAEGFRKITYYLDRPDVLSEFTTTIRGDQKEFPVLLSNGNKVNSGKLSDERHFATWHDPFRKPAYLFALVAGDLECMHDSFTTCSGRTVDLHIYVEEKDLDKCDHAMTSLKNAMRWDEEVYGREYDLDIFMIVAVDDFNMGAMENKGLNIFNTSCVLAKAETTTDVGFQRVEGVVAHEYFHNWSGNRVTCRDWFQLSLKEGFTVFRDAEFSADMGSRTVKRVEDTTLLRTLQFAEDGGPMAHPVQPPSYIEISNFYTLTIYEKGAEVVRMLHTLLGAETFRLGSDLYFQRHDGEAATINDFVDAMETASGRDLSQFTLWYRQAGTPKLDVSDHFDSESGNYSLTLTQTCPDTPEAKSQDKQPFLIPVALGLLGDAGNLPIIIADQTVDGETEDNTHRVLELTERSQTFNFSGLPEHPTPVLLRGFSAPVKLEYPYTREQLRNIMSRDADGFSRWDAAQKLSVAVINDVIGQYQQGQKDYIIDEQLSQAFADILDDRSLDQAMVALMLQLPTEAYLSELATEIDVEAIHYARMAVSTHLANRLRSEMVQRYRECLTDEPFSASASAIARRSLKNTLLVYLCKLKQPEYSCELALQQLRSATNMTDEMAALSVLVNWQGDGADSVREEVLGQFYLRWQHEPLVVNQWLVCQANCSLAGGLQRIQALMQHPSFDIKNPNKVRSLIGAFCNNNAVNFHEKGGAGYEFLAEQILVLNKLNPQIAARQLTPMTKWRKYAEPRRNLMRSVLERILEQPDLSKDVYEVVSKSL